MKKIWLMTGASRGLGLDIARAALEAGNRVVATGRNLVSLRGALPASDALLCCTLDVTRTDEVEAAVAAALERFGRIDVLANNAGYPLVGALEECSPEEIDAQFATNFFGLIRITRAILPVMRAQRAGHIINISSMAGILSAPGASLYCSSKFAVEGLSEGLAAEIAPLGIHLTIVEPGAFRTEFLTEASAIFSAKTIDDYASSAAGIIRQFSRDLNGTQGGDPIKLAQALVHLVSQAEPPLRFAAGEDAVQCVEQMVALRRSQLDSQRDLSLSLALEQPAAT